MFEACFWCPRFKHASFVGLVWDLAVLGGSEQACCLCSYIVEGFFGSTAQSRGSNHRFIRTRYRQEEEVLANKKRRRGPPIYSADPCRLRSPANSGRFALAGRPIMETRPASFQDVFGAGQIQRRARLYVFQRCTSLQHSWKS